MLGAAETGAPHGKALQDVVRNFPKCFTAVEASRMLDAAAEFGRKVRGSETGLTKGVSPGDISQAMQAATDAADAWRAKIPFFWQSTPKYCTGSMQHKVVLNTISKVYAAASGAAGSREVVKKARSQLKEELKKGPADLWSKAKPWVIGGLALLVAIQVGPMLMALRGRRDPRMFRAQDYR